MFATQTACLGRRTGFGSWLAFATNQTMHERYCWRRRTVGIHVVTNTQVPGQCLLWVGSVEKLREQNLPAIFDRARARGRTDDSTSLLELNHRFAESALKYWQGSFSTESVNSRHREHRDRCRLFP
jgi:hypothetical protein